MGAVGRHGSELDLFFFGRPSFYTVTTADPDQVRQDVTLPQLVNHSQGRHDVAARSTAGNRESHFVCVFDH